MAVKVKGHYGNYTVEVDGVVIGRVENVTRTRLWYAIPAPSSWHHYYTHEKSPDGTTLHKSRRAAVDALVNGTGSTY